MQCAATELERWRHVIDIVAFFFLEGGGYVNGSENGSENIPEENIQHVRFFSLLLNDRARRSGRCE